MNQGGYVTWIVSDMDSLQLESYSNRIVETHGPCPRRKMGLLLIELYRTA